MSSYYSLRIEDTLDCSIRSQLHQVTVRFRAVIIGPPSWLLLERRAVVKDIGWGLRFCENIITIAGAQYLPRGWRNIARKHWRLLDVFLCELGLRTFQTCEEFPQPMLWMISFAIQIDILLFE